MGQIARRYLGPQASLPNSTCVLMERSDKTLDPNSHRPSPLAALPHYTALDTLVKRLEGTLPPGMAFLRLILDVRQQTWAGLKDVMTT